MRKILSTFMQMSVVSCAAGAMALNAESARADVYNPVHIGAHIGMGIPSPDNTDPGLQWGGSIGVGFNKDMWNLSAFVSMLNAEVLGIDTDYLTYGLAGKYHFSQVLSGLNAGLKLGFVKAEVSGISATDFGLGPVLSYDYVIGNTDLSVGAAADMMFVFADDNYNIVSVLGTVKYWF